MKGYLEIDRCDGKNSGLENGNIFFLLFFYRLNFILAVGSLVAFLVVITSRTVTAIVVNAGEVGAESCDRVGIRRM